MHTILYLVKLVVYDVAKLLTVIIILQSPYKFDQLSAEPSETGMCYRTTASPSGTLKPSRLTFRIYSKPLQDVFIFTVYM
jgi:hypothetical protein